MVDLGMNVQATTDVARFDHSQSSDRTALDTYLFDLVGAGLEAWGHDITRAFGHAGGYQGILFERDPSLPAPGVSDGRAGRGTTFQTPLNGIYRAGSDPRKDGHAAGW
jgi:gamma-glutamyltranspeptidase/glutathione hydrolase